MDAPKTPMRTNKRVQTVNIPPSPCMKQIGYGTGVAVYVMQRSSVYCAAGSPWAVKKLIHKQKNNVELNNRIKEEAEILRKLNHPNIVTFKAFSKDSDGRNMLAMEECNSCLGDMIEIRRLPYPSKTILKVSRDIAAALNYLHNEALLIHCDVKSYNILVKGDFCICKLCDFGIALPVTETGEVDLKKTDEEVEYMGTAAWSAPEIISYPQVITTMADIYAYGLVIWEMIALAPPVDEQFIESFNASFDNEQDDDSCSSEFECVRRRPALPDVELGDDYNLVLEIFYCCTEVDKQQRPTAQKLRIMLEDTTQ